MNPNKALWEKGDFTRIAATMRESGEALVQAIGVTTGHEGARPRLRRRHDGAAGGAGSAPTCWASTSPATSSRPATGAPRQAGLANLPVPGGRRLATSTALDERQLRPRRQHLRRDVRAQAVRRRQGDGARHPARRPHRDGQLDPERSDAGRADPEDQLRLLAAAARGLRQPDDLGRREPTSSSASARAGVAAGPDLVRCATPTPSTSRARRRQFVDDVPRATTGRR